MEKQNAVRQIVRSSIAVFLGLAASSYYWLTMISEMDWLNHATETYQSGHYYFGNRFFPMVLHAIPKDYLDNLILSDILASFSLLFLISAVVYLFYKKSQNFEKSSAANIYRTVLPLGLFALFMTTSLSYPIWKVLTPLQKIQFPMRWMAVVSMCGAIVTAAAFHFLQKGEFFKKRIWIYASIIFVSIFLVIDFTYMLFPSAFVPVERARFESDMRELPDRPNQEFWWSVWSKEDALKTKEKVLAGNREARISDWKPEQRSFTVAEGAATKARIATFYYPRWQAEVNGSFVEIEKDENGAILIPLPAEKSTVKLYFQESLKIYIASVVSILTWLFILVSGLLMLGKYVSAARRTFEKIPEPYTAN